MLIAELHLQGSERVLDLGCGDGTLTSQIADLVPRGQVTGIDSSRGMIEETRQSDARCFETFRRINVSAHK